MGIFSPPPVVDLVLKFDLSAEHALVRDRITPTARLAHWGGAAANMIRGLRRGHDSTEIVPLFPIGSGHQADRYLDWLRHLGISTAGIPRVLDPLGVNIVLEFAGGHRLIARGGPPASVSPADYDLGLICEVSGLLINGSLPTDVLQAGVAEAERTGVPWAANPSVSHFDALRQGLAQSALALQYNVEEGRAFACLPAQAPGPEVARAVQAIAETSCVIVTLGPEGAVGACGNELVYCPAPMLPEDNGVVGCGDRHFALAVTHLIRLCHGASPVPSQLAAALHYASSNVFPAGHSATRQRLRA